MHQLPVPGDGIRMLAYPIKDSVLVCDEKIAKDTMVTTYDPALLAADTPFVTELKNSGIRFEAGIYAAIAGKAGVRVLDESDRSATGKDALERATFDAVLDEDVTVLAGARFGRVFADLLGHHRGQMSTWNGSVSQPDLVVIRREHHGRAPQLIPVDVKDHQVLKGSSKTSVTFPSADLTQLGQWPLPGQFSGSGRLRSGDWLQLAYYYRHFQAMGVAYDTAWAGIIGRDTTAVFARLDAPNLPRLSVQAGTGATSALEAFDAAVVHYRTVVGNARERDRNPDVVPLTSPEWKPACSGCGWRDVCEEELLDWPGGGHITLLPGITPARARTWYAQGVDSIRALASQDVPDSPVDAKAVYQARVTASGTVARADGVDRVDTHRADVEVDIDMENTNTATGQRVYLWGTRTTTRTHRRDGSIRSTVVVEQFCDWTDSDEGERDTFAAFWAYIDSSRAAAVETGLTWRMFHYSAVEVTWLRKLAHRYAGEAGIPRLDEVEALLATGDVVDLYPVLTTGLVWPTRNLSIKSLAKWAQFSWRAEDAGGDNSLLWHTLAVSGRTGVQRSAHRRRLLDYNADDLAAQAHLRDWVDRQFAAEQVDARLPTVTSLRKPRRALPR